MNIKYTDQEGNCITNQQVPNLRFYNKEFYNHNELKKVEKYGTKGRTNDIILKGGDYYLSSVEDLQTIVNQHKYTGNYWTFFHNKKKNDFGDVYWEYLFYSDGELKASGIKVFNNEKLLIASCTINLETNLIENKRKYFFGDLNTYKRPRYEYHFLSVSYDTDDNVSDIYIYDDDYQSVDEFISSYNSKYFDWMSHSYFHTFDPMLPTGLIV